MIAVDTSAVVAIFLAEPDARELAETIAAADRPRISAASLAETLIVLDGRTGDDNTAGLESLASQLGLQVEPVTESQALIAAAAYRRFGKGNHPARLNYGDCFAYALATELKMPLLYKGNDFSQTDIRSVL